MKQTIWSHTRLSLYHECPFAWKCRYVDKLPEAASEVFYNGRRFHQAVSEYATHCLGIARSTDYDVGRAIAARYADVPDVREMMEQFVESWAFDPEHMVGLEQNLVADLPNGDQFQGVPDYVAIDGALARITDWKLWHSWPAYDEEKPPQQLVRYAWLTQAVYPQVEMVIGALYFPRFSKLQEWEITDAGSEEIVEAAEWIKREVAAVGPHRFEPTPGGWCGLCGFTAACPVAEAIVAEGDVKGAAEKLSVLDGERGRLQALVRAWAKENGPLELAGGAWVFGPPDNPSPIVADMEGLLAFLSSEDMDWLKEITFPAKTITRWRKQFEGAIDQYLGEKDSSPTLRFRKAAVGGKTSEDDA